MTRQQAGVSAEAVAKLVAAWREAIVKLKDGLGDTPSYDLKRMIKERSEAFTICADELEALATAPPEQASEPFSSKALEALAEDILADTACTAKKMQSIWERAIFDKQNGWQVIADLFNANRPSAVAPPQPASGGALSVDEALAIGIGGHVLDSWQRERVIREVKVLLTRVRRGEA